MSAGVRVAVVTFAMAIAAPAGGAEPDENEPIAPPTDDVVVMPPGFLEWPGRWPRVVPVKDLSYPVPLGYHLAFKPQNTMWVTGAGVFFGLSGITSVVGGVAIGTTGEASEGLLFLPVFGPALWPVVRTGLATAEDRALFAGMTVLAAAQATGLGLFIGGLTVTRPVHVRNDVATHRAIAPRASLAIGPSSALFGLQF